MDTSQETARRTAPSPGLIATLYVAVGFVWIVFSDRLVFDRFPDTTLLHTAKGLAFIALSGLLIYGALAFYRRRLEGEAAAVAESEARFRQLAENVREVFWLVDAESREVLYVSPAYHQLWGGSIERLVGSPGVWIDRVHPFDRTRVLAALAGQAQGEYDLEYRLVLEGGETQWVRDRAFPIRDASGAVRRIAGIAEDVTERKRAEEELREARDTLRAVVDAAPVAIVTLDDEGRVRTWNRGAERMFGWTADEAIGDRVPFVPPEKLAEHQALAARALGEELSGIEVSRRHKDGHTVEAVLSSVPTHGPDGEVTGLVGALLDVTEARALEGQLLQAQKMEAIGRLAGGIAHDFNNLLTAISGYSELLAGEIEPEGTASEYLDEVRRAADHAARLTSQLLAFSRRQVLEPTRVDLNAVIREMEKLMRRVIGEDVRLQVTLVDDLWPVQADRGQLEQVVMNLAVNARDAMPQGGRLEIVTANTTLDEAFVEGHAGARPGDYATLCVQDTGIGMDPTTLEHAFEPFFTTKERGVGTGLGLSTVYGIVKQSGGYIAIDTEPGQGTRFTIYIPRAAAEVVAGPGPRSLVPARGEGETVLVVEDNRAVRDLIDRSLTDNGYHVVTAAGVEEGRRAVRRNGIDLVLTDVVLSDGSGRELGDAARENRIRILYMSGYTGDAIAHHGLLDTGVPFVQKPFAVRTLLARVREALEAPVPNGETADRGGA